MRKKKNREERNRIENNRRENQKERKMLISVKSKSKKVRVRQL
jgi:hypothetical protein